MADMHDEFYRAVGAKLAEARMMRGMSQADLAEAVGLSRPPSVANIEAGRQRMYAHTLVELAAAVAMPVEWLAW